VTHETAELPPDAEIADVARWYAAHVGEAKVELTEKQVEQFGEVLRDAFASIDNFLRPFQAKETLAKLREPEQRHEIERIEQARSNQGLTDQCHPQTLRLRVSQHQTIGVNHHSPIYSPQHSLRAWPG
jgi:hypothetical protein